MRFTRSAGGVFLSLALLIPGGGHCLELVAGGISEYVIVGNPADPAVDDLQSYVAAISGATLSIVPLDTEPLPERAVVVGVRAVPGYSPPVIASHGFHLKVVGNRLVIRGGSETGTQFGVYGLLSDHLGCRWLTPEFEAVPSNSDILIPDVLDEIQEPSVRDRSYSGGSFLDADWRRRNRVGAVMNGGATHNMYALLPPDQYFDAHPDWYPMSPSGDWIRDDPMQCMTWTNEGMIAELTRVVKERMAQTPADELIPVCQGDGFTPSYAPGDRLIAEQYGSNSAPLIYCMNRVL